MAGPPGKPNRSRSLALEKVAMATGNSDKSDREMVAGATWKRRERRSGDLLGRPKTVAKATGTATGKQNATPLQGLNACTDPGTLVEEKGVL